MVQNQIFGFYHPDKRWHRSDRAPVGPAQEFADLNKVHRCWKNVHEFDFFCRFKKNHPKSSRKWESSRICFFLIPTNAKNGKEKIQNKTKQNPVLKHTIFFPKIHKVTLNTYKKPKNEVFNNFFQNVSPEVCTLLIFL